MSSAMIVTETTRLKKDFLALAAHSLPPSCLWQDEAMSKSTPGFGIVGCGLVSAFHGQAIKAAAGAHLIAAALYIASSSPSHANAKILLRRVMFTYV